VNAAAPELDAAAAELARRLPPALAPLAELAYNYRWSWMRGGHDLFRSIDPSRFERWRWNPVRLLSQTPTGRLAEVARDEAFVARAERMAAAVQSDLTAPAADLPGIDPAHPVAFLCAEFGVHRSLHIYSGGLGVLAGDLLKAASDLRVPLLGIGLLYAQGNFRQRIDPSGWPQDFWSEVDPERLPAALVAEDGGALTVPVPVGGREILVQVWRVQVGRVPLYLLDANRPENGILDRWITGRLYVGDRATRLEQYAMLGVGAVRVLHALGVEPSVVHLNEGHAAFAPLEFARQGVESGEDLEDAIASVRSRTVFTTHTPVAAGNESYAAGDVLAVLGEPFTGWADRIRAAGATGADDQVGMTSLGLRLARASTAVSRRHGEVARTMWAPLFPGREVDDVPIGHVTNGVHLPTWMAPPMRALLNRHLGDGWMLRADDPATWEPVADIPDADVWHVRCRMRADLAAYVRGADTFARLARYESRESVEAATGAFQSDRLTLGFARRVATYKRLPLLYRDVDRVAALLEKPDTVQFVLAGKAHPKDEEAKSTIADLFRLTWPSSLSARMTFLEDYEMGMASHLVAGCDVWVNLPRPPLEASGTSGMKSALNGGLHLSVLDGWWAEAFDGTNGWAVGDHGTAGDEREIDERDADAFYDLIEDEVLPRFHERDADGVPRAWVSMVKASLRTVGPRFGATRMLRDYVANVYGAGRG
jgi:starch phosphorylase